ncbi:MAG TPA: hypothetical protein VGW35_19840 [Methylomirabilota bacterium]|nr:hypothetical protein [Methylomirabilota bacterium]
MTGEPPASPRFPRLFSPLALGKALTLRNRITLSPHTNIDYSTRPVVERRLRAGRVRAVTGAEVVRLSAGAAVLRDCFTGEEWGLDGVDTLVHDLGGRPRDGLYHALVAAGLEAYRVGDCLAPRGLEEAYHEGFQVALSL